MSNTPTAAPSSEAFHHVSVLLKETIDGLNPQPDKCYVDATLGGGGHSLALLQALTEKSAIKPSDQPILLGIDQDPQALEAAGKRLAEYAEVIRLQHSNYGQLSQVLQTLKLPPLTGGIMADLGVSSPQLDQPERGFSFRLDGPLDMRMDPTQDLTAETVVNTYTFDELVDIFTRYGEVRFAKTLARNIIQAREKAPFTRTRPLAQLIENTVRGALKSKGAWDDSGHHSHPATQCFQAIRIEVNQELVQLERFLDELPQVLASGARVAIITFHSLEDRLVKHAFQRHAKACVCPPRMPICQCGKVSTLRIITNKPLSANAEECASNPRARSAKLRVAERL